MVEICFTILDVWGTEQSLFDIGNRLDHCMSARDCHIIRTERSTPGQIFAVGETDGVPAAIAAADHLGVCIGRQYPVIVEITDSRTQQRPVLRRSILPPQPKAAAAE